MNEFENRKSELLKIKKDLEEWLEDLRTGSNPADPHDDIAKEAIADHEASLKDVQNQLDRLEADIVMDNILKSEEG